MFSGVPSVHYISRISYLYYILYIFVKHNISYIGTVSGADIFAWVDYSWNKKCRKFSNSKYSKWCKYCLEVFYIFISGRWFFQSGFMVMYQFCFGMLMLVYMIHCKECNYGLFLFSFSIILNSKLAKWESFVDSTVQAISTLALCTPLLN